MTNQPSWHCIANLGDADPFQHGGAFVCVDKFNAYAPILVLFPTYDDHEFYTHRRYTIELEQCFLIKKDSEIIGLGTNRFHNDYCEWFGTFASLKTISDCFDYEFSSLVSDFLSLDPIRRASAYKAALGYYGAFEFDQEPLDIEADQASLFCSRMFEQIEQSKLWHEGFYKKS